MTDVADMGATATGVTAGHATGWRRRRRRAVLGGTVLAEASSGLVGTAQAVAAGAVLAVVSIAIIPHAFQEVSGLVAGATVLGFVTGYVLS